MDRLSRALLEASRQSSSALSPVKSNRQGPSSLLPPPPRIGASVVNAGAQVLQAARQAAPPPAPVKHSSPSIPEQVGRMASIGAVALPTPLRAQEPEVEAWGVYETPYGPVAMPTEYGERNEYRLMGDPITDADQIERARNSTYAWDKLPEEQQREIKPPSSLTEVMKPAGTEVLDAARGAVVEAEARKLADAAARTGTMGARGGVDKALKGMAERQRKAETAFAVDGEAVPPDTSPDDHVIRIGTPDADNLPEPPEGYVWIVVVDGAPQPGQELQARLVPLGQDGEGNWVVPENLRAEGVMIVKAPEGVALPQADRGPLDPVMDFFQDDPVGSVGRGIQRTIEAIPGGEMLTESTLPEILWGIGHVFRNIPVTGNPGDPTASDVATSVWNAEIPGTDISLGSIGRSIWDFDIPGTETAIGDVLTSFFEWVQMPGDDAIMAVTDSLYTRATGNAVDSETQIGDAVGRIPIIGDFLENMYEQGVSSDVTVDAADAVLGKPYVDWIQQNETEFVDLYENGYDVDGDGASDVFGSDAVITYWLNEEANSLEALYVLTMLDPLTLAAGTGMMGKWVVRGGKLIRMADNAGPVRRTVGAATEIIGKGIYYPSRIAEGIGDLGAEYVLRGGGWFLRKTGITAPTASARRAAESAELGDVAASTLGRDRVPEEELVYDSRTGRVTNADGAEVLDESVPVGTEIATDFHNMTIVRTERGWDLVTTNPDGTTSRRGFKTAENAWRAAERSGTRATGESGGGRWERAAEPETSPKFIDQIPVDAYRGLRERLGGQWAASEEIMAGLGRGVPRPEHALESSRIARVTIDTAEGMGVPDLPPWALNEAHYLSPYYETMEAAIRAPWAEGAAPRAFLDGTGSVTRSDGLTVRSNGAVISAEPLPMRGRIPSERVRQANNYVDLISEHAKWHPADFSDASFADAYRRAIDIDDTLRARGRRTFSDLRPPLRDTAPSGFDAGARAATPTNAPGPDVGARAIDTPEAPAAPESTRASYPREEALDFEGKPLNIYDLGNGQMVEVAAIARADVPTQWQRRYPDYEGNRFYVATAKPHSEISAFAPTEMEALGMVEDTLRARGFIPGEGGRDVLGEVDAASADVVRFNVGRETPPTRLVVKSLPQVGESKVWHGIEIRAEQVGAQTVYTADTPGGLFSFVRQSGKAMPVSVEDGTITRLEFDRGRAISLREMGDHLYRMEAEAPTQAVDSTLAPEVEVSAPETPQLESSTPSPRMTPEQRRQRIQRIRGGRAKAAGQVRRTRYADPQKYTRALYGDVQVEGGVTVERLNPSPKPSTPPNETVPDPTGTVQVARSAPTDAEADRAFRALSPQAQQAVNRANGRPADWTPRDTPEPKTGGPHRVRAKATGRMPARNGFIDDQGNYRWLDRPITVDEVEVLTRHTFRDGKAGDTVLERVQLRSRELAEADNFKKDMTDYEVAAIRETLADYEKLLLDIHKDARLPQRVVRTIEKLPKPVRDGLEAVAHVLRKVLGAWDEGMQYARERMLASWMKYISYPMTQAIGNSNQLLMGGQFEALARMWKKDAWWESRKAILRGAPTPEEAIRIDPGLTPSQKMHAALQTKQGREITSIYHGMHGNIDDPLVMERALRKLHPSLGKVARLSGSKKILMNGAMFDASIRDALDVTYTMRHLKQEAIPDFRNKTIINLMEWGMSRDEARRLWGEFIDGVDGPFFSMNDVTRFFGRHVDQGKATRLGRDWQSGVNKAEKLARDAVRKYAFAGDATRADLVMSRVFIFHHFMTRQSNYYANLMTRHPYMINLYFNVKDELEKQTEGWPPYLQGWVKMFGTPLGFQLFLNPTALMSSYLIFNYDMYTVDRDNMSGVGYWTKRINDIIGINPILIQGLNMLGFFGEDFAPDPLFMWREMSLVTQAINWGRAHGWLGDDPTPNGNWYEQAMLDAREVVSGWNPWADQVEATSSEARMDREVNMLIADELERDGIDPESAEGQAILRDAMADPDSEYYQRAVKRWTNGEIIETATRFVVGPFLPRQRPVNEQGEDLYHSFSRELKQIVNTSDPRTIAIREQEGAYYDLGSERDNEIASVWTQVAYGDVHHDITVNGVTYTPREIYNMTPEQRVALANGLLAEYGLQEEYAAYKERQDLFLAQPENAEYAQFRTWAKAVRDYEGGIDAYWEEAASQNEDARRYYEYVNSLTLLPWERERRLTNMAAFMGLTGMQPSVWDPAPAHAGPVSSIYDPVDVANRAPQPIPYEEPNAAFREEVRQAPVQLAEMEAWDQEVKQVQAEMGIDPSIPFNALDYPTRKAIEETLEEREVYEPDVSWQVKKYLEWAEQQPRGADTSIEAFFAWSDREYRRNAPGRVEEKMNEVKPASAPDSRGRSAPSNTSGSFWEDLIGLINQHDHRTYP